MACCDGCRKRAQQAVRREWGALQGGLQHQQEPDLPGAGDHGAGGGPEAGAPPHPHPLQGLQAHLPAPGGSSSRVYSVAAAAAIINDVNVDLMLPYPHPSQRLQTNLPAPGGSGFYHHMIRHYLALECLSEYDDGSGMMSNCYSEARLQAFGACRSSSGR